MSKLNSLLICGGGNGMHALLPLAAKNAGCTIKVYTPLGHEASMLGAKLKQSGGIRLRGALTGGPCSPELVTGDPARAADGVEMVLLVLPAFAHGKILSDLAPYLPERVMVGAMPARSGFKYQAFRVLSHRGPKRFVIFGLQTLPWACRLINPGAEVEILGIKKSVGAAAIPGTEAGRICNLMSRLTGINIHPLANMLTLSLANVGQIIHPGIMYGLFRDYNGHPLTSEEIPLFYGGVDDNIAGVLAQLSHEVQLVKETLQQKLGPEINLGDVQTVREWLLESYGDQINDKSSLAKAFRTNTAYTGIKAPVKRLESDKYVPDFQSRYLVEDVPAGLAVTCALGRLAGVETPVINRVIETTSAWMGKEYLKSGSLTGKNIAEARIPQNFGINELVSLKKLLCEGTLEKTGLHQIS